MATALASQLAQVRAQSTNPLDLKAQRKAHSRSFLFEPSVAASQDFESLYLLCHEGFQELCRLDPRFSGFAANLFSEQSKYEDRQQMTATQNQRLDVVLEDFLHLVGSKLLIKPAHKAVEWLVRRYRSVKAHPAYLLPFFRPNSLPNQSPPIQHSMPSVRFSALPQQSDIHHHALNHTREDTAYPQVPAPLRSISREPPASCNRTCCIHQSSFLYRYECLRTQVLSLRSPTPYSYIVLGVNRH